MIYVQLLGTSAGVPSRDRSLASVFIRYKADRLLFDCGEGTQLQLMKQRLKFMKIDRIFITHWHADHFAGLPGLIQTMSLENRKKPLYIYGPKGTKKFVNRLLSIGYYYRDFDVIVKELKDSSVVKCSGYRIKAFAVNHNIPALGYAFIEDDGWKASMKKAAAFGLTTSPLIGELKAGKTVKFRGKTIRPVDVLDKKKGRRIVYTGDTNYSDNVVKHARRADLLIHEATFDSRHKDFSELAHASAAEAATTAEHAAAKCLVLTHISRRYQHDTPDDPCKLVDEARKIFKNSVLAEDFMEFRIK